LSWGYPYSFQLAALVIQKSRPRYFNHLVHTYPGPLNESDYPMKSMAAETRERHERRRFDRKGKRRPFVATDLGRNVTGRVLPVLIEYMASADARPPKGLETVVRQLPADELALIALSALLNKIDSGWDWNDESARAKISLGIGHDLRDQLEMHRLLTDDPKVHDRIMRADNRHRAIWKYRRLEWSEDDCARAGSWLLDCGTSLDFFDLDEEGFPKIDDEHKQEVDRLREELIYSRPFYLPHLKPPPDWTGWRSEYEDRIGALFVRDAHPETVTAIEAAFVDGSMKEHVDGVNALQRVPFVINEAMLPLVRKFAYEQRVGEKKPGQSDKEMTAAAISRDLDTAKYLAKDGCFYTAHNLDFRGRAYPLPHFNHQREDYVRSLFLFADGEPIGNDTGWLEIAAANHHGERGTWRDRQQWALKERELIMLVAKDPIGTFDLWRKVSDPFSFVAAAIELHNATVHGRGYKTRFPVLLDGSCNGIQHLALMTRDEKAALLVNLTNGDKIYDLYSVVLAKVCARLKAADDERARWWLDRGVTRKLIKQPVMTFSYGVTRRGAKNQIVAAYKEAHDGNEPQDQYASYLAGLVIAVTRDELRRPAAAMKFIRSIAGRCADRNLPMTWISPTGLPISNREYEPVTREVEMKLRRERVTYRIAVDWGSRIVKQDAMDAAPANFVHSLDASHLIRSVNEAVRRGITNVMTIHDCYGTTAPRVQEFQQIIRREMSLLYIGNVLADLLGNNDLNDLAIPPRGKLDPIEVNEAEFTFR
jgi:DNA-directed RNA polymerase, mitochondrial